MKILRSKTTELAELVTKYNQLAEVANVELPSAEDHARQLIKEEGLNPAEAIQKVKDLAAGHLLAELELEQVQESIFDLCIELETALLPMREKLHKTAQAATDAALTEWHKQSSKLFESEQTRLKVFAATTLFSKSLTAWKAWASIPTVSTSRGVIRWHVGNVESEVNIFSPGHSEQVRPLVRHMPQYELPALVNTLKAL
ncbi:hypothetical protein QEH52_04105 [Coraliomargarita sp. SDUM461003]|uniref:Uncharacterized protein n=1 Tax=Thalassobacterium maritimum TaxID=3041265 RepID=A0ABU1ATW7_9BACT|nr:hypothetical protein [Coraliomargarita sp. SDUM461003]MDQ8206679.1 hypothetical protein [Coraliomargarita sp. SDUM461003]